jgi:hypothetical protein
MQVPVRRRKEAAARTGGTTGKERCRLTDLAGQPLHHLGFGSRGIVDEVENLPAQGRRRREHGHDRRADVVAMDQVEVMGSVALHFGRAGAHLVEKMVTSWTVDAGQAQNKPPPACAGGAAQRSFRFEQDPSGFTRAFSQRGFVHNHSPALRIDRRAARIDHRANRNPPRPSDEGTHPLDVRPAVAVQSTAAGAYTIQHQVRARDDAFVPRVRREVGHHGINAQFRNLCRSRRIAG